MAIIPLLAGRMNLDRGPNPGDHMWVVKDATWQVSGYEKLPEWAQVSSTAVTSGHLVRGAFCWRGANTGRIYAATDDKFWEVTDSSVTNVTGTTTPSNSTNGVSFAGYGEWAFASNGVDKIQTIKVPSSLASTSNFEDMSYTTNGAKIAPKYICSHKNHLIAANIKFIESYGLISSYTTAVGAAFTNQPLGGSVQVLSSNNVVGEDKGPPTRSVTIWGTYTGGGDDVAAEVIAVNGTTAVTSARTNWQKILGVNADWDPFGTITVRKTTGAATITTFTAADGSGIVNVPSTSQAGGDRVLDIVASGATTKQVGFFGTTPGGTIVWDSQTLSGTTTVQSNSEFRSFVNVLIGDIENTVTVTVTSHQYPSGFVDQYLVWWSGTDDPEGYGNEAVAPEIIGSSNQPLLDGLGKVTGVVDGGDCFFVFKEASIYRFDGPPFQPTIISYSIGMAAGNVAYRQGDRIYFWSDYGLSYIDINSNQVVNVMKESVQRSVVDYATANFGSIAGGYPGSRASSVQYANSVNTSPVASISGDSVNSLIFVTYYNASAAGGWGLIFHERDDSFVVLTGPAISNAEKVYLVDYRSGSGQIPGLMSYLRVLGKIDATHMGVYKATYAGYSASYNRDTYFRWPFILSKTGGARTRVARVRPIFSNPTVGSASSASISIRVEVVSLSGVGKNWLRQGVFSVGAGTSSLDGWITVDGCPYADKHSIGVSFVGSGASGTFDPLLSDFVGVEVDFVDGTSKGI